MKCINRNSVEYQELKIISGIQQKSFDIQTALFEEKYGRLPRLDELQGSNSSQYLNKQLNIKNNIVKTNKLLEFTNSNSVSEAVININNKYLDQQTEVIDFGETSIIKTKQRPTTISKNFETLYEPDAKVSSQFIIKSLDKLSNLYGMQFKEITNWELEQENWKHLPNHNKLVKAFIYNGDIYINIDNATADSKVHELLHMLVGSIRFINPDLYNNLLMSIQSINNLDKLASKYSGRTQNDVLEEIFVTELSKQLVGLPSELGTLNQEQLYEIHYNVKRVLDTLLFGDYSSKVISDDRLYKMSLREVATEVNSSAMTSEFLANFNGGLHRQLNNQKSDLLKRGDLIQKCE